MKALVIGGDGLLGSHMVRMLIEQDFATNVLVQPNSDAPTLEGLPIHRIEGDLMDDDLSLEHVMEGCDYVFHLAAITSLWAPARLTWQVNLEGTRKVLDACLQAGIKRLVFCGSASSFQFGSLQQPGNEHGGFPGVYRGIPYMESKYEAMNLVRSYVNKHHLDAVIVAPTFMLGSYDARPSSGELIRQFLSRGMRFTSPGGRNFAYAPDVARATLMAASKGRRGEAYILGGHNLSYKEFFAKVAKVAGVEPPRGVLPKIALLGAGAAGEIFGHLTKKAVPFNATLARLSLEETYYSSQKAIRELGMSQSPVETGIAEAIGSLNRYGHLLTQGEDNFKGKVALVSGASRGVGFALAKKLVLKGAKVIITARGKERLQRSRDALEQLGGAVVATVGDVSKRDDAYRMIQTAIDSFGRLDILINNAGVSMRGSFADLSDKVCEQTILTNLMGSVYMTRAAVEHLIASRGNVVFISSIAGLFGLPGASTYCASKGALKGLCESLRLELDQQGVHCGIVHLGFTEHDPEKRILANDGSLVLPDRPAHHTQDQAADIILKMIVKRHRKVVMTPVGVLGELAYRASPSFVEWAIRTAQSSQLGVFKQFS